jgi:trk system potassium uptake protein TrkA
VKRTVARVNDPRNEHTFAQLGVDVPVNATNLIAQVINQEVSLDELSTLLKLKQGKVSLIQGTILQGSPLVNMELKDIPLPEDCIIVSVLRGDDVILPRGITRLEEKDQLLAVMTAQNEKIFNNLLVG